MGAPSGAFCLKSSNGNLFSRIQFQIVCLFVITIDYAEGRQISKLVDEAHIPIDECLEDELLQFADRFQEWALINKKTYESEDPAAVDLNAAVTQTRLTGWTALEKEAVLKVNIIRHEPL